MSINHLTQLPQRIPTNGTFELTLRCNLKCKMCLFRHDDCEFSSMKQNELSSAQWIDLAKQAAEMGTMTLLITGGEPLLREDFCEIWEGIYKQGFIMELYTNATLVNDRVMETLSKYPPHLIGVTLYGASDETYQAVCGNGKMFERAVHGIRRLMTLPSIISFRATIIKDNFSDAEKIEEMVNDAFGCPGALVTTRMVNKGIRGACANVEECRLEPDDNIKLLFLRSRMCMKQILGDRFSDDLIRYEKLESNETSDQNCKTAQKYTLLGCNSGMNQYVVTNDGKLLGCQMLDLFQTDVLSHGLKDAWDRFPLTVKMPPMNEKCRRCENYEYCNICPAVIYAETGSLGEWPEYICRDTEALLKKLVVKKQEVNNYD